MNEKVIPLEVKTNNVPRLILDWNQLTPKEQEEFNYVREDERSCRGFVRYKGVVYDLVEFIMVPESLPGWHGYQSHTAFSGVVFALCSCNGVTDYDRCVMGRYFVP